MAGRADRPLHLEIRREGSAAVVSVHGSAGMEEAEEIRSALEALTGDKADPIVLDLRDMDFISSAGLGAIVAVRAKSRAYEGKVALVSPQTAVRQVLETTRLTHLFPVFDTVHEAMSG